MKPTEKRQHEDACKSSSQSSRSTIRIALIQMCSTENVQQNCARAVELIRDAAQRGAGWVLLPENSFYIRREGDAVSWSASLRGDVVASFAEIARQRSIYLLIGSIPESIPGSEKVYNTSIFIDPEGEIVGLYRKLHLFDVMLPNGQVLNESRTVQRGMDLSLVNVDGIAVGLSICYDLRFPEMYRALTLAGAMMIAVPSAFTVPTGGGALGIVASRPGG